MESAATHMIIENVKIDKTIFMETYTHEEWLQLLNECYSHCRKDKKEFICVYCHYKKNLKLKIKEYQKKGCDKAMDFEGYPLKLKLYPPLKNTTESVYLAKGGNILKYMVKANALSKPRSSCALITLTLQLIHTSKHKCKKEKTPPLDIHDKVQKEFVVVHKKCLTKHEGQAIKQVSKPKRILEHPTLLEHIT
jgi:hypothetical protein